MAQVIDLTESSPARTSEKVNSGGSEIMSPKTFVQYLNDGSAPRPTTTTAASIPFSPRKSPASTLDIRILDLPMSEALRTADVKTLRTVLTRLYSLRSAEFALAIREELLAPATETECPVMKKRKIDTTTTATMRVATLTEKKWRRCRQCEKHFDITDNYHGECERHPGEIEMVDGAFPDDDEINEYGHMMDMTKDWRFKEFPDQFFWSCCEGDASAKPCRIGKHSETNVDSGSPGISEDEDDEDSEDEDEDEDNDKDEDEE